MHRTDLDEHDTHMGTTEDNVHYIIAYGLADVGDEKSVAKGCPARVVERPPTSSVPLAVHTTVLNDLGVCTCCSEHKDNRRRLLLGLPSVYSGPGTFRGPGDRSSGFAWVFDVDRVLREDMMRSVCDNSDVHGNIPQRSMGRMVLGDKVAERRSQDCPFYVISLAGTNTLEYACKALLSLFTVAHTKLVYPGSAPRLGQRRKRVSEPTESTDTSGDVVDDTTSTSLVVSDTYRASTTSPVRPRPRTTVNLTQSRQIGL